MGTTAGIRHMPPESGLDYSWQSPEQRLERQITMTRGVIEREGLDDDEKDRLQAHLTVLETKLEQLRRAKRS